MQQRSSRRGDRRNFTRFETDVPVVLHDDGSTLVTSERTADLAYRGVCVAAHHPIDPGTELEIEIEVLMPTRISLGYDINALSVDGPPVSHTAIMRGIVRRCRSAPKRGLWHIGIEFLAPRDREGERIVEIYLDQLDEQKDFDWTL